MALTGTFKSYDNLNTYTVTIGEGTATTISDPTANDQTSIMFGPDPVNIRCDRGDLTQRIIISQATINLVSSENLTDELFATTNRSISVTITNGGSTCFFGYVDPLQFSQGFAHNWETITVTATDPLGALEQLNAGDLIGITAASSVSPSALISAIFTSAGISGGLDNINQEVATAMGATVLKMSTFFGDTEDDWMTLYEILEEVCKYFNLYVAYYGQAAHVTCTINANPTEINVLGNATSFGEIAADDSTSISVDDTYAKVAVTAEIEPVEDIIIDYDNNDFLYSDYDNYEKYMTEIVALGDGETSYNAFLSMINGNTSTYDGAINVNHFCWLMKNDLWDFGENGYDKQTFADQRQCLQWLKNHNGSGAIIGFGKGNKVKPNPQDNAPMSSISLTNYLVVSVDDRGTGGGGSYVCSYNGLTSAILSPADANVTNYIVISGKLLLNPKHLLTGPWQSDTFEEETKYTIGDCLGALRGWPNIPLYKKTVGYPESYPGSYYQQYWLPTRDAHGVYGFLDNSENKDCPYKCNKDGSSNDEITKIPILECSLQVGNKYCVERLDIGQEGVGKFEWMTAAECQSLNISPTFTIGINPKIGDYLIGQSFDIQNNVNYKMGLDKTGTAIPIKLSDQLAGEIDFKILGPCSIIWNRNSHATRTRFIGQPITGDEDLLQYVQSIMISNLKIETTTDNGMINPNKSNDDNDLVYALPIINTRGEMLEDSVKICTPLTQQECNSYNIKYQVSNSYVYYANNTPFYGFGSGAAKTKPEACLADYYYNEYESAAKMITTGVRSDKFVSAANGTSLNGEMLNAAFINIYPGDSSHYRIMSYETSLKYKNTNVTLREYKTYGHEQI